MIAHHYEINVALNGKHLFATAPRSCTNKWDAERVLAELSNRFPKSEGFNVSITAQYEYGQEITQEELK